MCAHPGQVGPRPHRILHPFDRQLGRVQPVPKVEFLPHAGQLLMRRLQVLRVERGVIGVVQGVGPNQAREGVHECRIPLPLGHGAGIGGGALGLITGKNEREHEGWRQVRAEGRD